MITCFHCANLAYESRRLRDWRRPRGRRVPPDWGGLMLTYSRLTSISCTQPGGRPTIVFSGDVSSTQQHWRRIWPSAANI